MLGTDVFSFFFKRDPRAALYAPHLAEALPCLSFQSVAELRYWALIRRWGDIRRSTLDAILSRYTVLSSDDTTSRLWADLSAHRRPLASPSSAAMPGSRLAHSGTALNCSPTMENITSISPGYN
jgi:predicted nucleic acid-binding protein